MKKKLGFLIVVFSCVVSTYGQKVISGTSDIKYVSIKNDLDQITIPSQVKDKPKLPNLEIVKNSMIYKDEKKSNNKIDANENGSIQFELQNSGSGLGKNLSVVVSETNKLIGLNYYREMPLDNIGPGEKVVVNVPVNGLMDLPSGEANFSIRVNEPMGFGSNPMEIQIPTQEFQQPLLTVVDSKISSQESKTLELKKTFGLDVLIQNRGKGAATDIEAILNIPPNVNCLSGNEIFKKTSLAPGETLLVSYNLVANIHYNSKTLPVYVKLKEKYEKYSKDSTITLDMHQAVSENKIIMKGSEEPKLDFKIGSLFSIIDKNIPVSENKNPNRFALVIGNENYATNSLNAEINVVYALDDADTFRKYAISTLGVEDKNMFFITDATSGKMQLEIDRVSKLVKAHGSDAELIFYYAGHGLPDDVAKAPVLIPVDVNATNLQSAIKLADVYNQFGETGAKSITIFLDACFSGGGRSQGLLAGRGVRIKPRLEEILKGNLVVFSATSGLQTALPFNEEKHGMFTYFLLKKMQDTKGKFTYGQMADYLNKNVTEQSLRTSGKDQNPEVQPSPEVEKTWRNWSFQ